LALDADAEEPFVLDLSEYLMIGPAMPVTYLHPARLIRTDVAETGYGFMSEDAERHGGADAG
jgi:hypothetical protein